MDFPIDPSEQLVLLVNRVEQLERKVGKQRREIDALRKRVDVLEDAIPEWEPEEE